MKFALYLTLLIAAMVMMVSAAPSNKSCYKLTDKAANSTCQKYCGSSGYTLGECGLQGICICKSKKPIQAAGQNAAKNAAKKAKGSKVGKASGSRS